MNIQRNVKMKGRDVSDRVEGNSRWSKNAPVRPEVRSLSEFLL